MFRTLITLLLLVLVAVLIWMGYQRYYKTERLGSGEVRCEGCMTGPQKEAFLRENAGEGVDGQSEHKWDFSRGPYGEKREYSAADGTYGIGTGDHGEFQSGGDRSGGPEFQQTGRDGAYAKVYTGGAPPAHDSIPPNPPNGERFGGRGQFQWYRQGNVTWRVDTVTGQSCIAYATLEEWRKRLVAEHGCGAF